MLHYTVVMFSSLLILNGLFAADVCEHTQEIPLYELSQELIIACQEGNAHQASALLRVPGIDINAYDHHGNSALLYAAYKGYTDIIELLLSQPELALNVPNGNGDTALIAAAGNGHAQAVKLILHDKRTDINKQNSNHLSALTQAMWHNKPEIVRILLTDERTKDLRDYDDLMSAFDLINHGFTYNPEITALLLTDEYIALINTPNEDGNNALIYAADQENSEVIRLLLASKHIDINHQNNEGETALMILAAEPIFFHHSLEAIQLLLKDPHLNINMKNNHGESALAIAITQRPNKAIAALLIQAGAEDSADNRLLQAAIDKVDAGQQEWQEIVDLLSAEEIWVKPAVS